MLLLGALIVDLGIMLGERIGGIRKLSASSIEAVEALARKRIGRADLMARIGPSLGLIGTLIPLGPGIAALGQGDFQTLAVAITTAFDTTVLGLLIGILGYLIGRWRRVVYDRLLGEMEASRETLNA